MILCVCVYIASIDYLLKATPNYWPKHRKNLLLLLAKAFSSSDTLGSSWNGVKNLQHYSWTFHLRKQRHRAPGICRILWLWHSSHPPKGALARTPTASPLIGNWTRELCLPLVRYGGCYFNTERFRAQGDRWDSRRPRLPTLVSIRLKHTEVINSRCQAHECISLYRVVRGHHYQN